MKNKILKGVTGLAVTVCMLAACALDSNYLGIALVSMTAAGLWLSLFCFANRERLEGR